MTKDAVRLSLETLEAQRHEQRRIDAIRARNVATLAALEQQRLKGRKQLTEKLPKST